MMAHHFSRDDVSEYYVKYHPEFLVPCIICGEYTKNGRKTCSDLCSNTELHNRNKGRKQTKERIAARVAATDQKKKQQTRQETMMDRYGTMSTVSTMTDDKKQERSVKISNKLAGKPHSKEHHEKVIAKKKENGKLKHTEATKKKMSASHIANYLSDDPPVTLSISRGRGHKTGNYNGLYYRSSYELEFLRQCEEYNIDVESAGTKEWRVSYIDPEGKRRQYYPDFYLPKYGLLIEIKPESMLHDDINQLKFDSMCRTGKADNYAVLTEEDIFGDNIWADNLEHFLS